MAGPNVALCGTRSFSWSPRWQRSPVSDRVCPAGGLTPTAGGTYPLHIKFHLLYQVEWSFSQGLEGASQDGCAPWSKDRGVTTVVAEDAPWKRKGERRAKRHGVPGSLTFYAGSQAPAWAAGSWAGGSAVGRAKGTVQRRWVQDGGPDEDDVAGPCKDRYITTPWRPVPTDCGARSFTTRTATFVPQRRKRLATLDDLVTVPGIARSIDVEVFAVTSIPHAIPIRAASAPRGCRLPQQRRCSSHDPQ